MSSLNAKVVAYLAQNKIAYTLESFRCVAPDGADEVIDRWDAVTLGPQPTAEQLDAALVTYIAPEPTAPTKEELMAELAALTAKIQALS